MFAVAKAEHERVAAVARFLAPRPAPRTPVTGSPCARAAAAHVQMMLELRRHPTLTTTTHWIYTFTANLSRT